MAVMLPQTGLGSGLETERQQKVVDKSSGCAHLQRSWHVGCNATKYMWRRVSVTQRTCRHLLFTTRISSFHPWWLLVNTRGQLGAGLGEAPCSRLRTLRGLVPFSWEGEHPDPSALKHTPFPLSLVKASQENWACYPSIWVWTQSSVSRRILQAMFPSCQKVLVGFELDSPSSRISLGHVYSCPAWYTVIKSLL